MSAQLIQRKLSKLFQGRLRFKGKRSPINEDGPGADRGEARRALPERADSYDTSAPRQLQQEGGVRWGVSEYAEGSAQSGSSKHEVDDGLEGLTRRLRANSCHEPRELTTGSAGGRRHGRQPHRHHRLPGRDPVDAPARADRAYELPPWYTPSTSEAPETESATHRDRAKKLLITEHLESTGPSRRFEQFYVKGSFIEKGTTGVVYTIKKRDAAWGSEESLVCKEIGIRNCNVDPGDRSGANLSVTQLEDVHREIEIMTTLRHPNLAQIRDYFIEDNTCKLVMQRFAGGELVRTISRRGRLTEAEAREVTGGVLRGLAYMHSRGIAHRDLKPENVMLDSNLTDVKIIDFGLAKLLNGSDESCHTVCGSPLYIAPEMLTMSYEEKPTNIQGKAKSRYSVQVDIWACGVILYVMLTGKVPFNTGVGIHQLFNQIRLGTYSLSSHRAWESISSEAKDLVQLMMTPDPGGRITAEAALLHPWMATS